MDELRFNTKKHDENVKDKAVDAFKLRAGKIWTDWKNRVKRLPKNKRHRGHIVKMLAQLRKELEELTDLPELGPWKSYTLEIIDDVIERSNISLGLAKNTLTEYVPTIAKNYKPKSWTFGTLIEFSLIPIIAKVRDSGGKFLRDGTMIYALYGDGEIVPVGRARHSEGIALIQTVAAFQAELEASRSASGSGPGPAEGGSTPDSGPATPGSTPAP